MRFVCWMVPFTVGLSELSGANCRRREYCWMEENHHAAMET